eukprot:ctg_3881.g729
MVDLDPAGGIGAATRLAGVPVFGDGGSGAAAVGCLERACGSEAVAADRIADDSRQRRGGRRAGAVQCWLGGVRARLDRLSRRIRAAARDPDDGAADMHSGARVGTAAGAVEAGFRCAQSCTSDDHRRFDDRSGAPSQERRRGGARHRRATTRTRSTLPGLLLRTRRRTESALVMGVRARRDYVQVRRASDGAVDRVAARTDGQRTRHGRADGVGAARGGDDARNRGCESSARGRGIRCGSCRRRRWRGYRGRIPPKHRVCRVGRAAFAVAGVRLCARDRHRYLPIASAAAMPVAGQVALALSAPIHRHPLGGVTHEEEHRAPVSDAGDNPAARLPLSPHKSCRMRRP